MQITKEWLKEKSACYSGYEWALKVLNGKGMPAAEFIYALLDDGKFQWANWVIVLLFKNKELCVRYAIFAAEQVLEIYEKRHPENKKPRAAIEAAKNYLKDPSSTNMDKARSAADASKAAAYASDASKAAAYASDAAYAASDAAYAAYAAAYAADAAYAASDATAAFAAAYAADAAYAAYAAAYAADAAKTNMMRCIIEYGLTLIK